MKNKKGFTLIELLMVIAIIGLLSSVVLGSLNSARDKGNNAAVMADLSGIRAQSEIYYDTNGNYGSEVDYCTWGMFNSDIGIKAAIEAASSTGGGSAVCSSSDGAIGSGGNATSWAISVPLKSSSGPGFWCVDSQGTSRETDVLVPADITAAEVSQCP